MERLAWHFVRRPGTLLRAALAGDLILVSIGIAAFALLPLFPSENPGGSVITPGEWAIAIFAMIGAYGLIGRVFTKPRVPMNEWAYLVTLFNTFLTFLIFVSLTETVSGEAKVVVSLFLWSGIVGSFAAHLVDGGPNPPKIIRRAVDAASDTE